MQIIDNINKTVKEDLQESIRRGSKMSVAAACFSMYAYQELKKQLEHVAHFCQGTCREGKARVLHSAPEPRKQPVRNGV